jgi:hypothetical protein
MKNGYHVPCSSQCFLKENLVLLYFITLEIIAHISCSYYLKKTWILTNVLHSLITVNLRSVQNAWVFHSHTRTFVFTLHTNSELNQSYRLLSDCSTCCHSNLIHILGSVSTAAISHCPIRHSHYVHRSKIPTLRPRFTCLRGTLRVFLSDTSHHMWQKKVLYVDCGK